MAGKFLIYDLDDTGMETSYRYTENIERAVNLIRLQLKTQSHCKTLSLSCIEEEQQRIDSGLRRKINPDTKRPWYYSMERFPTSLVLTYQYFCKALKVKPDKSIEQELYKIGMSTYKTVEEYRKDMKREFGKILQFHHEKKDCMDLLTKGDPRVQDKKIEAMQKEGLLQFFCNWHIVPDKNISIFRDLVRGHSRRKPYSVGNEYDSDIAPAIKAGCFGIWIPFLVWNKNKMREIEKRRDKKRSKRWWNLMDIKKNYRRLNRPTPRD